MLKLTLTETHMSRPPCDGDASDATDSETAGNRMKVISPVSLMAIEVKKS